MAIKNTNEVLDLILDWLEVPQNFNLLINKIAPDGSKLSTKNDGLAALAHHVNMHMHGVPELSLSAISQRLIRHRLHVYVPARKVVFAKEGFHLVDEDHLGDIHSLEEKRESLCHGFDRFEKLFGHSVDLENKNESISPKTNNKQNEKNGGNSRDDHAADSCDDGTASGKQKKENIGPPSDGVDVGKAKGRKRQRVLLDVQVQKTSNPSTKSTVKNNNITSSMTEPRASKRQRSIQQIQRTEQYPDQSQTTRRPSHPPATMESIAGNSSTIAEQDTVAVLKLKLELEQVIAGREKMALERARITLQTTKVQHIAEQQAAETQQRNSQDADRREMAKHRRERLEHDRRELIRFQREMTVAKLTAYGTIASGLASGREYPEVSFKLIEMIEQMEENAQNASNEE
ncbi:hypothetical protein BG004_006998 [Podila humilis]|nr:hypothetical protein BG004_006998 [Podila humilis]